jgi:hypothetical protein
MGTRSFTIKEQLADSYRKRGRLEDYIQSQALVAGFSPDTPHSVMHDHANRCLVVSQETTEGDVTDEDPEVRRRDSTPIH